METAEAGHASDTLPDLPGVWGAQGARSSDLTTGGSRAPRLGPTNCSSGDIVCQRHNQGGGIESQEWQLIGTFEQKAHCND